MNDFKGHTPGPWIARQFTSGNWQVVQDATGYEMARTCYGGPDVALIAAAPRLAAENADLLRERDELREALSRTTARLEYVTRHNEFTTADHAAIEAARALLAARKEEA